MPKFRLPDIGRCKDVRFAPGRPSRSRGATCGGGALGRRGGEGKPDAGWGMYRKPDAQAKAGEGCRRFAEDLAEHLGGVPAMRRAERSQGDIELAVLDADVACGGEQLMELSGTSGSPNKLFDKNGRLNGELADLAPKARGG